MSRSYASVKTIPQPPLTAMDKGLGEISETLNSESIPAQGWNMLREDISLPAAVLYRDKVEHNLEWMSGFIAEYGVQLAPHGKTTMAPQLFALQLQHGAWGITLATANQTLIAYRHGVRRVLMANQLVGKENMNIISGLVEDPEFEYYCLVDSREQIDQLGAFFSARGQRLPVLVELGLKGGRTGVRDEEQLRSVLAALDRWRDCIALSGVEIYEGILHEEAEVRAFLDRAIATTRGLMLEKRFQRSPILLSGAGSMWYDVVAESFSAAGFGSEVEIVLRPGCYIAHDVGKYRESQERILAHNPVAMRMQSGLVPALHIWAYVLSRPEAGVAIVGMGRRDASFDSGLPVPALSFRPGKGCPSVVPSTWQLSKMMDQHAFLQISAEDDLRVGDMVAFDILHPCLTFDKWRTLLVVDAQYQVVDVIQTFF